MPDQVEGLTALSLYSKSVHRVKLLAWTCYRRCSTNPATPPHHEAKKCRVSRGAFEALPLEDRWADVFISNGVINLCADKKESSRKYGGYCVPVEDYNLVILHIALSLQAEVPICNLAEL